MKIEVTVNDFISAFLGRDGWSDDYKNSFSYRGLVALYDYLEEFDEDLIFDRTEIYLEFTEYDSLEAFNVAFLGEKYRDEFYSHRNLRDGEPENTILVEQENKFNQRNRYSVIWHHGN